jgi:pimeloyl-ACP methyl ester carboxylesterase
MPPSSFESLSATLEGHRVSFRTAGSGFPVLLLPGWGGPTDKYEALQEKLAALGYRTVVPDLPGLPGNTEPSFMLLDRWGHWVDSLARVSLSAPFILVSHSFSAMVAVQYLSKGCPDCLGAIFVAPWLFSSRLQAAFWRLIARLTRYLAPVVYPDMRWLKDRMAWRTTLQLFARQRPQSDLPCLVLWGRKDWPRYLFTGWKRLACETRVYGWGHSPQIVNTGELADVIDGFIRGL